VTATRTALASPGLDPRAFGRVMTMSYAVHIGLVVLLLVVPREWWLEESVKPEVINISLGAATAQNTSGMTAAGARPVEEVAPQPKRAEPIKQAAAPPPKADASLRTTAKPPPAQTAPPAPAKPTTGKQIVKGTSAAEMGALGQGTGLAVTSGGGAEELNFATFCCPDYLTEMGARISDNWQKDQVERGLTILKFTIQKDGTITDVSLDLSSGSGVLDRAAQFALRQTKLPPLPAEYPYEKLIVHLKFPYGAR
jgi:TonB family protein